MLMRACGFELGQEPYTAAALSAGLDCTLNRPPKQPARLRAVVTRRWIELVQRRSGFPPRQLPHAPPAQSMAATGSGRRWSPSAGGFPRTGGVAARGRRRPLRPLARGVAGWIWAACCSSFGVQLFRIRIHSPPAIERGERAQTQTERKECVRSTQRDRALGPKPNEIVNSDTGRQPSGAALPCEGELSRLRSGGTPASLLSSRHLSCRSIRGLGLLDERAEDLPH